MAALSARQSEHSSWAGERSGEPDRQTTARDAQQVGGVSDPTPRFSNVNHCYSSSWLAGRPMAQTVQSPGAEQTDES
jgi:hypothetical protein